MATVKQGDRVKIDYTGKLDDGTIIDSTRDIDCEDDDCSCGDAHDEESCCASGPMELTIGAGEFFPQIEEALIGMAPGETKTVLIPAEDAFGDYDEEQVFTVNRSELPADLQPEIGAELVLTNEEDENIEVTVIAANETSITFDANHPLAGEDLSFDIELLEIVPA